MKIVRFGEPPRTHPAMVVDTSVENRFYDADWLPIEQRHEFEQALSQVEGAAADSLRRLFSNGTVSSEDRYNLSAWAILQYGRTRGKRHDSVGMQKFMLRATLAIGGKQQLASVLQLTDPDEIEWQWNRIVLRGEISDPPDAKLNHARTMLGLIAEVAPIYANSHWEVIRFERKTLFTADNPLCLWRQSGSKEQGIGLLSADMASIALDRHTGLVIVPSLQDDGLTFAAPSAQRAVSFNVNTWLHAEEYIVLHPDDDIPNGLPGRSPNLGTTDIPDIGRFIDMGDAFRRSRDD